MSSIEIEYVEGALGALFMAIFCFAFAQSGYDAAAVHDLYGAAAQGWWYTALMSKIGIITSMLYVLIMMAPVALRAVSRMLAFISCRAFCAWR